jgi:hypothetical protein
MQVEWSLEDRSYGSQSPKWLLVILDFWYWGLCVVLNSADVGGQYNTVEVTVCNFQDEARCVIDTSFLLSWIALSWIGHSCHEDTQGALSRAPYG